MKRVYSSLLQEHFDQTNKSVFLSGARQVGKTTIAQDYAGQFQNNIYLTWDSFDDRERILKGQNSLLTEILSLPLAKDPPVVIFDEIHKYNDWKNLYKGALLTLAKTKCTPL